MSKRPKAKRSAKAPVEADARVYFTDGAARRRRREIRERGAVQENVIDSVNRRGSLQLEFIVSAGHVLGAIDSSQESELVTTM